MPITDKLLALCPPDVFYNDLDKQALALCLKATGYVRRFKNNPCVPQETRLTLEAHIYDLVERFVHLSATQKILAQADHASEDYRFVIDTIRILLRHDLGESIFEPQSYLEKVNPALPKIDAKAYESGVALSLYDMAQQAAATCNEENFLTSIHALQTQYDYFDAESAQLTGPAYADYLYQSFDRTLARLQEIKAAMAPVKDKALIALIAQNNRQHQRDYETMENAAIQHESPAGLFAKIIDTSQLEEIHYEVEKLANPALPYKSISQQHSGYMVMVCKRSEKFMPRFFELAAEKPFLHPFRDHAYELSYTRAAAHALVLRPYASLREIPNEPDLYCDDASYKAYCAQKIQEIAVRRRTIHPLDDPEILSNHEIAAKILCYRELKPDLHHSIFDDPTPADAAFKALFATHLMALQSDQPLANQIARLHDLCAQRLDFYR